MRLKKRGQTGTPFWFVDPDLSKRLSEAESFPPDFRISARSPQPAVQQADISRLHIFENEDANKLLHLWSRASFGLTVAEFLTFSLLTYSQAVDALLKDVPTPPPPGDWVTEPFDRAAFRNLPDAERQEWRTANRQRINELLSWWLEGMLSSPLNLREKITLFWHGHFTSDIQSLQYAQVLYLQNHTWRTHALGNFRDFLKAMYKDPGMLFYLNGVQNHANEPNENFARELLELFTLGVGHYTETDIREAARAFTGWQVDTLEWTSFLNNRRYDSGAKHFLGKSGNWTADDIIDIILDQEQTALFICTKLFEYFISREVDEAIVRELAATFRSQDYEIKPVLKQIFNSEFFASDSSVGSIIKSPVDLAVSNARMLGVQSVRLRHLFGAMAALGQELLNPPNVAGWPGQRAWISPTTYVSRNVFSETYIDGDRSSDRDQARAPIEFDPMEFARSFGIERAEELLDAMTQHLLRVPVTQVTREFLLQALLGTANAEDWSLDYPGTDRLVSECLVQIVRLPEFQLS